jgi:hypothetical protein
MISTIYRMQPAESTLLCMSLSSLSLISSGEIVTVTVIRKGRSTDVPPVTLGQL